MAEEVGGQRLRRVVAGYEDGAVLARLALHRHLLLVARASLSAVHNQLPIVVVHRKGRGSRGRESKRRPGGTWRASSRESLGTSLNLTASSRQTAAVSLRLCLRTRFFKISFSCRHATVGERRRKLAQAAHAAGCVCLLGAGLHTRPKRGENQVYMRHSSRRQVQVEHAHDVDNLRLECPHLG